MNRLMTLCFIAMTSVIPLSSFADGAMRININTASVEELDEMLEGVGERIAREIVAHRVKHGEFDSLEELDEVKYVGSSIITKNRDRIVFE